MTEARLDPYAILGVARDASPTQIQQAYRRLAKRYHPDLQQAPRTTEQMQRLNQAWAILSKPASRARHDSDQSRSATSRADAWSGAPSRAWHATSAARPHSPSAEGVQQARRPWLTVVITAVAAIAVIWLVIGAALFGGLPLPLLGLVLFAVTRTAFRRQL
jgi:curved DNA-binding protein CbpA